MIPAYAVCEAILIIAGIGFLKRETDEMMPYKRFFILLWIRKSLLDAAVSISYEA